MCNLNPLGVNYDNWRTRTPKEWELEEDDLTPEEIKELAGEAKYEAMRDES